MLETGALVADRYRLDRLLGEGGMGTVWAATHTVTRRRYALKFLKGPSHLNTELRRRFVREARAASAVEHPNVVQIHDVFEADGMPIMVMDLLEGETLGQRLQREQALPLSEVAATLVPVVSAVGSAHALGIVHRDLKPDNIFLARSPDGNQAVRVLDFGVAKLMTGEAHETGAITGTGALIGTPCYMSPEQAFGEKSIDHRSDVWAIGVILYEALTGSRPVEGDNIGQVVKRLMSQAITPIASLSPDLPQDVADFVDRLLSRQREERPADLSHVLDLLERYTEVRAPRFGPPSSQKGLSEEPNSAKVVVSTPAPVDAADTTHAAPIGPAGPATAGATSLSVTRTARRRSGLVAGAGVAALGMVAAAIWIFSAPRVAPVTVPSISPVSAAAPEPSTAVTPTATPVESSASGVRDVSAAPSVSAAAGGTPASVQALKPKTRAPAVQTAKPPPPAPSISAPAAAKKPRASAGLVDDPPF